MATLSSKTGLPSFSQSITEINYFTDGGFERGVNGQTPVGWSQYQDAAAAAPVDGTGGTAVPTVTMLCSNSSPIRGVLSAVITKDAVNRQGVGYAFDFTISPVDKGVTTEVSFEMQTSLNFASGDVVFYVFDVTNSILITPRNTSLTKMDNYGKFFSDFGLTTGTQYRFILHIATVNALAWTLKLDTMVNTTTKAAVAGGADGEYENVTTFTIGGTTTPPTLGTGTTYLRNTYKEGRWAIIRYEVKQTVAGTIGSGDYLLPLPTGLTIDYTRLGANVPESVLGECGEGALRVNANQFDAKAFILNSGVYTNKVFIQYFSDTVPITTWGSNGSFANAAVVLGVTVRVPINEWANSGTNLLNQNTQSPIRAGTVQAFAGATTPAGWLDCDGSSKLIVDYPQLYAQIGTTWATCTNPLTGVANSAPAAGSFRVPDLRGAFVRGAGGPNAAGVTTALAGFQADTTARPTTAFTTGTESAGHTHTFSGTTDGAVYNGSSSNRIGNSSAGTEDIINMWDRGFVGVDASVFSANLAHNHTYSGTTSGASVGHTHTITGGGDAETRPDSVGLRMIIKAWDESFNLAGFAQATATQMGLVQGGTVPGSNGAAAIAAGYIGERIAFTPQTVAAVTTGVTGNGVALGTLTAGVWQINWYVSGQATSSTGYGACIATNFLNDATGNIHPDNVRVEVYDNNFGSRVSGLPHRYIATGNTTLYAKAICYGANRNVIVAGEAIRIA